MITFSQMKSFREKRREWEIKIDGKRNEERYIKREWERWRKKKKEERWREKLREKGGKERKENEWEKEREKSEKEWREEEREI